MTDLARPPAEPICSEPGGERPCKYGAHCPASRQYRQAGYERSESGHWMQVRDPLQGTDCWAYGTPAAARAPANPKAAA